MSSKKIKIQKKYEGSEDQVIMYQNNDSYVSVDAHNMFIMPEIVISDSTEDTVISPDEQGAIHNNTDYLCYKLLENNELSFAPVIGIQKPVWYLLSDNSFISGDTKAVFKLNEFGNYRVIKYLNETRIVSNISTLTIGTRLILNEDNKLDGFISINETETTDYTASINNNNQTVITFNETVSGTVFIHAVPARNVLSVSFAETNDNINNSLVYRVIV